MTETPFDAVLRYVSAFNDADVDAMAAACSETMHILDGMPPHVWHGPAAARTWWRDVMSESEHSGASDYHIVLGEPRHLDVNGAFGYVVVPASMTFSVNGTSRTQAGSTFTVALRKIGSGWALTAWSWSKGGATSLGDQADPSRLADGFSA
ncbi:nuclear transport factor 2 family protein [Mycobacterium sp. ZZG]